MNYKDTELKMSAFLILQEFLHSVSDQIQNLQNCFTTPNKMTNKDDIWGLVSLKFLRPWFEAKKKLPTEEANTVCYIYINKV
jgi:hypothetical protein